MLLKLVNKIHLCRFYQVLVSSSVARAWLRPENKKSTSKPGRKKKRERSKISTSEPEEMELGQRQSLQNLSNEETDDVQLTSKNQISRWASECILSQSDKVNIDNSMFGSTLTIAVATRDRASSFSGAMLPTTPRKMPTPAPSPCSRRSSSARLPIYYTDDTHLHAQSAFLHVDNSNIYRYPSTPSLNNYEDQQKSTWIHDVPRRIRSRRKASVFLDNRLNTCRQAISLYWTFELIVKEIIHFILPTAYLSVIVIY